MPGVRVYVGDTDAEAREIERELQLADQDFDRALAELGRPFAWHDFRQYDLDAPFPQAALTYAERGFRTHAEKIAKLAQDNDFTLRQTVRVHLRPRSRPRSPAPRQTVADQIQQLVRPPAPSTASTSTSATPASAAASASEVVPILQERGLVRREYESATLRGNLGLPVPENRYTEARLVRA